MGAIKLHRGSASSMSTKNPILEEGELFMEYPDAGISNTASYKFKVGDGSTPYNNLPYAINFERTEVPTPSNVDEGKILMVNSSGQYYLAELDFLDGDTIGYGS